MMSRSPVNAIPGIKDAGVFESLLMRLAIDFVNMPPAQIDEGINRALAMTGEFSGVDRAYVMAYDFERRIVDNTHEWCADGIVPMIAELQGVPMDGIEDEWIKVHLRGDVVHVENVRAMPANAPLRRLLEPQGIITLVAVPMSYQGRCLGFVGFDAVRQPIDWTAERLSLVRVLAEVFTNAEMGRRRIQAIESERAKAETASGLLKRAVDATGTAVWEFDAGGDEVLMLYGWNRLLGMNWDGCLIPLADFRARVHPNDLEEIDRALDPAIQSHGNPGTVEFRIRGPHNDWLVFRAWWIAEHQKNHAGIRFYGGTIDITDSVRGAQKNQILRQISSRFVDHESYHFAVESALAEISHYCDSPATGLFIRDESGGNPAAFAAPADESERHPVLFEAWSSQMNLGTESHRMLAKGECVVVSDLVSAEDRAMPPDESIHSVLLVPMLAGGSLNGALAVAHREKEGRVTHDQMDFLISCAEIISGAIGRLMAENLLRENAKVQELILNRLSEIIFLMDPQYRITFINRAGGEFFGEATPALVGRRITDLPSLSNSPILAALEEDFGYDRPAIVMQLRCCFGDDRIVSFQHRPIVIEGGFPVGILGIITDITEQQVFETNLISEKIKAEATSDAKTLFISNFSHEIRTPMHGVLGVLELMIRSGRLDLKNKMLAETAHRSGLALVRLFDDVLDIAKLERGAIKLHPAEIDLKPTIESLVAIFQMELEAKSLEMHLELDGNLPRWIVIDELRLRQIVSNLLSNAIKFTHHGSISLNIRLDTDAPLKNMLSITVEDTGIGIPEQGMGVLFEPFVQLQTRGPARPATGSGLGLPITKQLVQIMHGRIAIESQVGVGTKVNVRLPFEIRTQPLHHTESMDEFGSGVTRLSGFSVLVAEDNEINRILACEHLRALECEVVTVENGLEAVEECRNRSFDAVIMDCAMPVMDGYEASRRIIEEAGGKVIPIILGCTANASQQTVSKCLASGMRYVIVKPYTREQIRSALLSISLGPIPDSGGAGIHLAGASPDIGNDLRIIDYDILGGLEELLGKSSPGMKRIFSVFRDSSRQQFDELSDAIKSCDWRTCRRVAHSLKGGAASIGAARLAAVCAWIESDCADHAGTASGRILQVETIETLMRERSAVLKELEIRLFKTDPE